LPGVKKSITRSLNLDMLLLRTQHFVLREFKPDEQDTYVSLYDDERVTAFLLKRSKIEHEEAFRAALDDYAASKIITRWGLFNIIDGDYIGSCLLRNFYDHKGKVELGFSLRQKYWGKGIASEIGRILIDYGFANTDANEIVAVTMIENLGSQKVLQKAEMKREDNYISNGIEPAYYTINRGRWKFSRKYDK